jgi:hypothetical protein
MLLKLPGIKRQENKFSGPRVVTWGQRWRDVAKLIGVFFHLLVPKYPKSKERKGDKEAKRHIKRLGAGFHRGASLSISDYFM